jgi:hypothetical protein
MTIKRNIITLSNMPPELEEWAREEAKRQNKPFHRVVTEALEVLRMAREGQKEGAGAAPSIGGPTAADPAGGPAPSGPQGQTSPVLS